MEYFDLNTLNPRQLELYEIVKAEDGILVSKAAKKLNTTVQAIGKLCRNINKNGSRHWERLIGIYGLGANHKEHPSKLRLIQEEDREYASFKRHRHGDYKSIKVIRDEHDPKSITIREITKAYGSEVSTGSLHLKVSELPEVIKALNKAINAAKS